VTIDRLIALEGAVNFRDLGGYATADGYRTRWRTLFRADGLGELTGADLAIMRDLGIQTVVDLRTGYEVEQSRYDIGAHPVAFHHFPFIETLPEAKKFTQTPGLLGSQYREMLDGAALQIVGALSALAVAGSQPAVFHCTAGKDRTGLLSALVLSLLGVPEETVVADYALSGEAMTRLRAKLVFKFPASKQFITDSDAVFSADPANMVALLAHLRARYGSVVGYATEIGLPDDVISRLRGSLLEPAV
jgi:protein-tyrosine phosphatase